MADLIWRWFNKQSHHDVSAIVKDYPCVSQLHNFKHFTILAFFASWLLLGKKKEIWILLITHNKQMLRQKYVKSR